MLSRARTLLAMLAATAAAAAAVGIAGASQPTAASNASLARAIVAQLFARAPLPPGSVTVGSDPSAGAVLGSSAVARDVVGLHGFWRVPGEPRAVVAWLEAHPPAGGSLVGTGTSAHNGVTFAWSLSYYLPGIPGRVEQVTLASTVAAAAGGGTALRVDAGAMWMVPRPAWERVPPGVRAVEVELVPLGRHASVVRTVSSPAVVHRLIAYVDGLSLLQPGTARACPALIEGEPLLGLAFIGRSGARLARIAEDGCDGIQLWLGARRAPELNEDTDLGALLRRLGALPGRVCYSPCTRRVALSAL